MCYTAVLFGASGKRASFKSNSICCSAGRLIESEIFRLLWSVDHVVGSRLRWSELGPHDMMPYQFYRHKKCDARQGHVPGEWSQCKGPLDVACAVCISIWRIVPLEVAKNFRRHWIKSNQFPTVPFFELRFILLHSSGPYRHKRTAGHVDPGRRIQNLGTKRSEFCESKINETSIFLVAATSYNKIKILSSTCKFDLLCFVPAATCALYPASCTSIVASCRTPRGKDWFDSIFVF